jgi:hypothetical protein
VVGLQASTPLSTTALSARKTLNVCTFVSRSQLERAVGNRFSTAHSEGDNPIAAGCHLPAKATGGTDLGLFVSTDVPAGIAESFDGDFFLTLGSFQRTYGTANAVTGIGTGAYVAFIPGDRAQGALLVDDTATHAVLVVLVGTKITLAKTISIGKEVARIALTALRSTTRR